MSLKPDNTPSTLRDSTVHGGIDVPQVLARPERDDLPPAEVYQKVAPAVVAMKVNGGDSETPSQRSIDLNSPVATSGSGFVYES